MTSAISGLDLAGKIVAYPFFALLVAALLGFVAVRVASRIRTGKGKLPGPVEIIVAIGFLVGLPAALTAGAALLITPLLLAMPLPLAGWLLIGALALFGLAVRKDQGGGDATGCTRTITFVFWAYTLCWVIAVIILARPPGGVSHDLARPLLVGAIMPLIMLPRTGRKKIKQLVGFGLVTALLVALAFLPIERGFAASLLPASDWLRFPISGAVAAAIWPLLAIPFSLVFGSRAISARRTLQVMGPLALIGGLFGLFWAITRLLF